MQQTRSFLQCDFNVSLFVTHTNLEEEGGQDVPVEDPFDLFPM